MKSNIHKQIILILLLSLLGCNNPLVRKTDNETNVFEVERQAEQAYEEQDWRKSEQFYTLLLVQRIPENAKHWFRLGNVYARTQRPDAAVVAYREALLRDPKMSKAWFNMGVLQLKQAANSFDELQSYIDMEDPLYTKGRKIFTGIVELIKSDNNKAE